MRPVTKGHFTHETESLWPFHFKHSHWWKKVRASPSSLHITLEGPTEYANVGWMDSYMAPNGSCYMVTWTIFKNHLLVVGLTQNRETKNGTPNAHNRWFILCYYVWGPAWTNIHWNSIWLRARSHMTSHCTWGPVTTLEEFGGVLGRPLDTFFRALTISWLRLVARVWSGPKVNQLISKALHWVPIPMGFGWAWVRCYCSWVGMSGHWFCASMYPAPNRSQTSRMQGIR
jgi:hypothetical protein